MTRYRGPKKVCCSSANGQNDKEQQADDRDDPGTSHKSFPHTKAEATGVTGKNGYNFGMESLGGISRCPIDPGAKVYITCKNPDNSIDGITRNSDEKERYRASANRQNNNGLYRCGEASSNSKDNEGSCSSGLMSDVLINSSDHSANLNPIGCSDEQKQPCCKHIVFRPDARCQNVYI